ncbi:MAG: rod shape-determining protein MreC [Nitrospirae bacterium]|nr:rod shape-determining protein MreC [Nitrospirota bacterium]
MPKKRLLLFFSFIIISFILMTYQSNRGAFNPLRSLNYPINTANKAIHSLCYSIKTSFRKIYLRDEENKRLKEQINSLLLEQHRLRDIVAENARLRELLSLKEKERRYAASARVISRGNDRWANTLVIDKGKRDGIEKDMAVITPLGLAGKILSVSDLYSSILLLNDINFSAAIRLNDSRVEGIISGTGGKICILKYIPHEYEVKRNETVFTSGLDSLFPVDIPIGTVTKISKKDAGLFQNIEVTPFQDNKKLEEVIIIRR